jgi:CubicO group peptidase (beta-lactamase class C family)
MAGMNVSGFPGYAHGKELPTLRQVLDGASPANTAPIRNKQQPGKGWKYSGGGYTVVQQFLMDVYGDSFQELMDRLILKPASMEDSTFEQPLPRNLWQSAAVGHHVTGVPIKGNWHTYPELAAAGLWTTPSDLARFALAVQHSAREVPDNVLPRKAANLLLTPQYGSFSLGLAIRGRGQARWFYHNGANAGFRCLMYGYLDAGEGAVVMTNSDNGMELAQEIVNAIAEVYDWPGFVPEN